jgi:hypothetical protein
MNTYSLNSKLAKHFDLHPRIRYPHGYGGFDQQPISGRKDCSAVPLKLLHISAWAKTGLKPMRLPNFYPCPRLKFRRQKWRTPISIEYMQGTQECYYTRDFGQHLHFSTAPGGDAPSPYNPSKHGFCTVWYDNRPYLLLAIKTYTA